MRGALVLLAVVACKATWEPPPKPPPKVDFSPYAGGPVIPGNGVHAKTVDEGFIIVVPPRPAIRSRPRS